MGGVGLVLGAGGIAGHAFHAGVLAALEESTGWKPDAARVIVGTSAGSIVAALIRAGCPASDLANASMGTPLSPTGQALFAAAGRRTRLPVPGVQRADLRRGPAAAGLLLRPWAVRTGTLIAGLLPAGKVSSEAVASGIRNLYGAGWPGKPTWICAVRLDDGRPIVFGRPGSPQASMAEAVAASCAIPAYFAPVVIDGARHIDGGAQSVTNADLLADVDLDLVIVSCPMASSRQALSFAIDTPLRAAVGLRLAQETAALRRAGIEVVSFLPTSADRAAMGYNAMDGRRRSAVTRQAHRSALARLEDSKFRSRLAALG